MHLLQRYFDRTHTINDLVIRDRPKNESECRYFKLPFIGKLSSLTKTKLKNIVQNYCKTGTEIRVIFTTKKIGSYFSLKDSFPKEMLSKVVYKFVCASCKDCYVGETTKRYSERTHEHLFTDSASSVYQHLHGGKEVGEVVGEPMMKTHFLYWTLLQLNTN